ncbi:hypothetical protein GWI33_011792 [Rhynchophorus ferrugineus]|uniref:Uncharacterized protein n=1 Tax=Rhynchophorus ferrugineus TaxID=354439 RepID=A0A834IJT1_RHYFE|nr:hypothetical protein GWI33_011792 [Rhynchophorus ferrugineus]
MPPSSCRIGLGPLGTHKLRFPSPSVAGCCFGLAGCFMALSRGLRFYGLRVSQGLRRNCFIMGGGGGGGGDGERKQGAPGRGRTRSGKGGMRAARRAGWCSDGEWGRINIGAVRAEILMGFNFDSIPIS